jgi:hypothetical protein
MKPGSYWQANTIKSLHISVKFIWIFHLFHFEWHRLGFSFSECWLDPSRRCSCPLLIYLSLAKTGRQQNTSEILDRSANRVIWLFLQLSSLLKESDSPIPGSYEAYQPRPFKLYLKKLGYVELFHGDLIRRLPMKVGESQAGTIPQVIRIWRCTLTGIFNWSGFISNLLNMQSMTLRRQSVDWVIVVSIVTQIG